MEKYFRETLGLFKDFKRLEGNLNKEFEKAANSRNFSKQYLQNLATTNREKINKERKVIENRFSKVREELITDLENRYDFETSYISDKLIKLLQSGIELTPSEYTRLAEKHKDNIAESRILHDVAKKNGFVLDNYISFDETVAKFDTHLDRLKKSMWEYMGSLPFYPSVTDAEIGGGKLYGELLQKTFECYETPKDFAELLAHDIKAEHDIEQQATADDRAFVTGFTGREPEQITPADLLTAEELEDAQTRSVLQGRNGIVDDSDVEFIRHSAEYQEILSYRVAGENEKADAKMEEQGLAN
jgi:hypothetical protein